MSTNPRQLTGVVISDKANKTITVKIERKVKQISIIFQVVNSLTSFHVHILNNVKGHDNLQKVTVLDY